VIYRASHDSGSIRGAVSLPSSKSISNRLLIIKALSSSPVTISNLSQSDDTIILKEIFASQNKALEAKDAGTVMRFLTAYLATRAGEYTLGGSERMSERPVGILVDALRQLGAKIEYTGAKGYPPLKITGSALHGGQLVLDGSVSSQFITALLLIAPVISGPLSIEFSGKISSRPYISMTLQLLNTFGIESLWKNNKIKIRPGHFRETSIDVEADWSAASYWYSMVALAKEAEITLTGLTGSSIQGDSIAASVFSLLGVRTTFTDSGAVLTKSNEVAHEIGFDFTDCPDLAPAIIVTSAALRVPGLFTGIESLKIKESNRITALQEELHKLDVELIEISEIAVRTKMNPEPTSPTSVLWSHMDHRIAMSLAPLGLVHTSVDIKDPEVTSKSYPNFWNDLKSVGFEIRPVK